MKKTFIIILFSFWTIHAVAQIPEWRIVDWSNAGLNYSVGDNLPEVNITDFGAIANDDISDDAAISDAINSFSGDYGKILIPAGDFIFTQTINLPTGITLYGQGYNTTVLKFNLSGTSDLIVMQGSISSEEITVTKANKGDDYIILSTDVHNIEIGEILKLSMDGTDYMFSDWALSCMAQIIRVKSVNVDTIFIESSLRHGFPIEKNPVIKKIIPVRDILIAGISIEREDATVTQTSNISMNYAYNCQIRAIESSNCNFAHISISNSTNITVAGCYLHHAFAYGGGGQGYGTEISASSGECLIENNIFEHLRHSILLQSGANGNVAGYNYSFDPFWTEDFLPAASAGDLVLHGNYAYCNLFEGNIAQNAIIDDSHDINGPFNTFFRNRLEKYGIVMNFNPPTDSSNFVGNEITNDGFLLGNYTTYGQGNFSWGNNVKGTCNPSSTNNIESISLYRTEAPCYFYNDFDWAPIGYPSNINENTIPAKLRYNQGFMTFDTCINDISTIKFPITNSVCYPNPFSEIIYFQESENINFVEIYDIYGRQIIIDEPDNSGQIKVQLVSGLYFLVIRYKNGEIISEKVICK